MNIMDTPMATPSMADPCLYISIFVLEINHRIRVSEI